ncbi:unnamed protein product [Amoebophrya sp. A120]|nr:unnamed protein product [Amoebophrya sp. A120]|eukprot:GSA120T00013263001.1
MVFRISTSKAIPAFLSGAALVFGEMHTPAAPAHIPEAEAGAFEKSPTPRSFTQKTKKVTTSQDLQEPVFSANVTLALQVVNDPQTPIPSVLEIFEQARNALLCRLGADEDNNGIVSNLEEKKWCSLTSSKKRTSFVQVRPGGGVTQEVEENPASFNQLQPRPERNPTSPGLRVASQPSGRVWGDFSGTVLEPFEAILCGSGGARDLFRPNGEVRFSAQATQDPVAVHQPAPAPVTTEAKTDPPNTGRISTLST